MKLLCITIFVIIHLMMCKETRPRIQRVVSPLNQPKHSRIQIGHSVECPVWFFYNHTIKQCECFNIYPEIVKCVLNKKLFLSIISTWHIQMRVDYSSVRVFIMTRVASISLLLNLVLLNFLATTLNSMTICVAQQIKKAFCMCSEFIDSLGPSATSLKLKCSNCTNAFARYSLAIYLL